MKKRKGGRFKYLALVMQVIFYTIINSAVIATENGDDIISLVAEARIGGKYVEPNELNLKKAEILFSQILKEVNMDENFKNEWNALGFDLIQGKSEKNGEVIIIKEKNTQKEGRGVYLFQKNAVIKAAIEAPHSFDDLKTDEMALQLFGMEKYNVFAISTVKRSYYDGNVKMNSDMAHLPKSYFIALSKAFASTYPKSIIVQLHGFEATKRISEIASTADIILSAGEEKVTEKIEKISNCFKRELFLNVLVYPRDVQELGALTNTQAQAVHALNYEGFIHIEMAKDLREILVRDKNKMQLYSSCIEEAA